MFERRGTGKGRRLFAAACAVILLGIAQGVFSLAGAAPLGLPNPLSAAAPPKGETKRPAPVRAQPDALSRSVEIIGKKARESKFFWERSLLLKRSETLVDLSDIRGVWDDSLDLFLAWREFVAGVSDRYSRLTPTAFARVISQSFGSVFLLILFFALGRWFRRWFLARIEKLPEKTIDPRLRATEEAILRLALVTIPKLFFLAAVLISIEIFTLEDALQGAAAVFIGGFALYAFLRVLIRDLLLPLEEEAVPPFGIPREVAESARPAVLRILAFCAWTLIPIAALEVFSYRPGFIALLWTIFWVGMVLIVISVASQEMMQMIFRAVAGEKGATWLRSAPGRAYRVSLLVVMTLLLLLYALGFVNLTRYLLVGLLFSGVVVAIGRGLNRWCEERIRAFFAPGQETYRWLRMEAEEVRRLGNTVQKIVRYIIYTGVVLTLLMLWGVDLKAIAWLLALLTAPVATLGGVRISIANLAKVAIVLVITWWLSRYLRHLIRTKLEESSVAEGVRENISVGVNYLVLGIGIFIALNLVGVDFTALTIFAGVIGIGVGFGLQTIVNNLISGVILLVERTVQPSDFIEVGDTVGIVQKVTLRSTVVRTLDNISVIVPNSSFITNNVTNWSHDDRLTRGRIPVGVAYSTDAERVRHVLLGVAEAHETVLKQPPPRVLLTSFGDSSLNFELLYWVKEPKSILYIKSDLLFGIDAAFRRNKIRIPFPQRDVNIFPQGVRDDEPEGGAGPEPEGGDAGAPEASPDA